MTGGLGGRRRTPSHPAGCVGAPPSASLSTAARRSCRRVRGRRTIGGTEVRHRRRAVLRRALSRTPGDAGRADLRGAGAGRARCSRTARAAASGPPRRWRSSRSSAPASAAPWCRAISWSWRCARWSGAPPRWRLRGVARVEGSIVAEADFTAIERPPTASDRETGEGGAVAPAVHPTAIVADGADARPGGARSGRTRSSVRTSASAPGRRIGPHAVIEGRTTIGRDDAHLPVRERRRGAAGPQVPRRGQSARDRRPRPSSASSPR